MKPKVYIETTIPSYLAARPSRDLLIAAHQQVTHDWWERRRANFELYTSDLVIREASAGDPELARARREFLAGIRQLRSNEAIVDLTEYLIIRGPFPGKAKADAAHIAIATVYACEYLLTWNCRHIANAELQRRVRRITEGYGYFLPVMCTPEELLGETRDVER